MNHINNIAPDKSNFLQIISTIADPPKSLWFRGTLPAARRPTMAIIGTRRPTHYGQEVGYRLSYDLAQRGVVIVSGLALGMDSIAHKAALDAGGTTIAVLPCGLDRVCPYSHRALAERIVANGGALISEYAPGAGIFKSNFIARNRIVTGISDGLLVVEAAAKSGTMHTTSFALEQGRAVMSIPGNITNPMSEGCNNLIKMGARPISSVAEILHEIGWADAGEQVRLPLGANASEHTILRLLASGVRDGDELQRQSSLTADVFSRTLTMLEISGSIRALGGNQWAAKK